MLTSMLKEIRALRTRIVQACRVRGGLGRRR
jgi:hypothetical protein